MPQPLEAACGQPRPAIAESRGFRRGVAYVGFLRVCLPRHSRRQFHEGRKTSRGLAGPANSSAPRAASDRANPVRRLREGSPNPWNDFQRQVAGRGLSLSEVSGSRPSPPPPQRTADAGEFSPQGQPCLNEGNGEALADW